MNKLSARRVSTAAALGGALGVWFVAMLFAAQGALTIESIGFRTENPLLALAIAAGGGGVAAMALFALERVLFDRDELIPEAIAWTGRVVSLRRNILLRAAGVAVLVGMFPFVGFIAAVLVAIIVMPLMLLHRGRLSGEPEHFQHDAGGLGCITMLMVVVLSTIGGWIGDGVDWALGYIDTPPVIDTIGTTLWSILGTLGTLMLLTVILERAEFEDVVPLLKRFLCWRVTGIAVALYVRVSAIVLLVLFPLLTIAVVAFRATSYDIEALDPVTIVVVAGVCVALIVPPISGWYLLVAGRTLVHLFPEPLRPEQLQTTAHEEPPQAMPLAT